MLNSDRLRIVMASSEAVPFSKTGGLADVSTALSKALSGFGHDVTLVIPDYRKIRQKKQEVLPAVTDTGLRFALTIGEHRIPGSVNWTMLPDCSVRVLLVQSEYFDRPQIYMENGQGYEDNSERFCFFSRAVLEICQQMVLRPDILHCNDWQTGLIPALLNTQFSGRPGFENAASVMTLHNMAFQGRFPWNKLPITAMDARYFNMHHMETWGDVNLLKTGIAFADQITTVSPTYAHEVCTPLGGEGLDALLSHRGSDLVGILNGIDTDVWNPATDPLIPANYSLNALTPGKPLCKSYLQKHIGLPCRENVPLLGMVSRMSDQKGFDLIAECANRLLFHDIQMVFLGTGEGRYEDYLQYLSQQHPGKVAAHIGFDESLAHQIEAGSDIFLMPSRFEPCGLNQMYSLAYGTLPLVRKVGGLADSVVHSSPENIRDGKATGFVFDEYDSRGLAQTVEYAIDLYRQPQVWKKIMSTAMAIDWSWSRSAKAYVQTYHRARERRHDRRKDNRE
ncbi:MAG: glycogen synthase GlgA [Planctomycetaceae bacterium]|nr:glycogen synthase GlgA [Planctomycetaceae bacterium]